MTGPRRKATDSSLVQGPVKSAETIWGISTGYLSREMGDASVGKNAVTDLLIIGSKMHLRLGKHREKLGGGTPRSWAWLSAPQRAGVAMPEMRAGTVDASASEGCQQVGSRGWSQVLLMRWWAIPEI